MMNQDQDIMFVIKDTFRRNGNSNKWLSLYSLYSMFKGRISPGNIKKALVRLHSQHKIEIKDWAVRPTGLVMGLAQTRISEDRIYEMLKLHGGMTTSEASIMFQDMYGPCNTESLQRTMRRLAEGKKLLRKNKKYYLYKLKEFTQTRLRTL